MTAVSEPPGFPASAVAPVPAQRQPDSAPGRADAAPGWTDAGPGWADAGPGWADAGPGSADPTEHRLTRAGAAPHRVRIAGVPVDLCSAEEFVTLTVALGSASGGRATAVGVNAHVINICAQDSAFCAAVAASDLLFPDGQSVVWAARMAGHRPRGRVPLTHLTAQLGQAWAAAGLRIFLLGGRPGVAERAANRLAARYGVMIAGTRDGYFADRDDDLVVEAVNASGADVLVVGLGNPRQELWLHAHRARLAPPLALTCGGWLDWTAGDRRPCPPWIYRWGLEWAYRLGQEPRRLYVRYLVGNPAFVVRVVRQWGADRRGPGQR
jgi:N-acetylglucosaminyldiphosphoundecaprenol N-acetyl-beta-D-mannosaminyltransferase